MNYEAYNNYNKIDNHSQQFSPANSAEPSLAHTEASRHIITDKDLKIKNLNKVKIVLVDSKMPDEA